MCPEFSTYLINTYREPSNLYVSGSKDVLLSEEGTTQGDNAAMGFYACSISPLVNNLSELEEVPKQVWYADDGAAGGTLDQLQNWWNHLCMEGPGYGYYPKPSKTVLVVKEGLEEVAKSMFPDIQVKSFQHKYLGSFIGSEKAKMIFEEKNA